MIIDSLVEVAKLTFVSSDNIQKLKTLCYTEKEDVCKNKCRNQDEALYYVGYRLGEKRI